MRHRTFLASLLVCVAWGRELIPFAEEAKAGACLGAAGSSPWSRSSF
jgi:hypothetical protein